MFDAKKMKTIESLNLVGNGLYPDSLTALIAAKPNPSALVLALNNADTDGAYLQLLDFGEEAIFEGASYLASTIGAKETVLYLPEFANGLEALKAKAESHGVRVEVGIVDVRKHSLDLMLHLLTAYELGCALKGKKEDGIFVSVNGGALHKVPASTSLLDLVGAVKGVRTSYVIRNASDLRLTLAEVPLANGVVQGISEKDCVVSLVAEKLLADRRQSCGKCVFCREGLLQLEAMTRDMTLGRGKAEYLDLSEEIGDAMTYSTPCSMGQTSSLLLLSAIQAFPAEFEAHIKKKKCPAEYCKAFQKVYVDPLACIGCARCLSQCPTNAIDGAEGYIHIVFDNDCTKCRKCLDACPVGAIHLTTGALPRLPYKMMRVGRFKKL